MKTGKVRKGQVYLTKRNDVIEIIGSWHNKYSFKLLFVSDKSLVGWTGFYLKEAFEKDCIRLYYEKTRKKVKRKKK